MASCKDDMQWANSFWTSFTATSATGSLFLFVSENIRNSWNNVYVVERSCWRRRGCTKMNRWLLTWKRQIDKTHLVIKQTHHNHLPGSYSQPIIIRHVCLYCRAITDSVQPPPSAINVTLSAFAAERWRPPLSVDISCSQGAQQQTRRPLLLLLMDLTDKRTEARPHRLTRAASARRHQFRFSWSAFSAWNYCTFYTITDLLKYLPLALYVTMTMNMIFCLITLDCRPISVTLMLLFTARRYMLARYMLSSCIRPSVRLSGDAAFCQITLTTWYWLKY